MKVTKAMMAAALVALSGLTAVAERYPSGIEYSSSATEINPGEWNCQFTNVLSQAERTHTPLLVFWGNGGCGWCERMEYAMANKVFTDYQKGSGSGMGAGILYSFTISQSKYGEGTVDWNPQAKKAKSFANPGTGEYPYVAFYWLREDGTKVYTRKTVHLPSPNGDHSKNAQLVINMIEEAFAGFTAHPGGSFVDLGSSDEDRLEAGPGLETLTLKLTRSEGIKKFATNDTWKVTLNDGTTALASGTVEWPAGQTEAQIVINPSEIFPKDAKTGDTLTVTLVESRKTATVTYVTGNSAANPLWIGERKVPGANAEAEDLGFGEWTMDLNVATTTVARCAGKAYTVVAIQGSMWCPDCANTERNFLDLEDEEGNNRFAAWAKSNNVALVSIDIPAFSDVQGSYASPTLLSRKAYSTTLARNSYTNKVGKPATPTKSTLGKTVFPKEAPENSGADPELTVAKMRSGLGYLTRKNVSDADAADVLERNHRLVRDMTTDGGFNRIEDNKPNRTGVPIFVLLRQDGTVAGRFTQFASASPMKYDWKGNEIASRDFNAYVKRLEELMEDADNDPLEVENNDARTTAATLTGAGAAVSGNISHADAVDVFELTGVSGGVLQSIALTAHPSEKQDGKVTVELQQQTEGQAPTVVATATGSLQKGVFLEHTFTGSEKCYVAVKPAAGEAAFAVNAPGRTRLGYALVSSMLLVPEYKANRVTAKYDKVAVRIVKGNWYWIENIKGVPGELTGPTQIWNDDEKKTYNFYYAEKTGDVTVETTVGAEIDFQLWDPGAVGFAYMESRKLKTSRTVKENVGTVEIPVARALGASDEVKVKVWLDEGASENIYTEDDHTPRFDTNTYHDVEFTWGDGESGVKNHTIDIIDDVRFDGPCKFVFKLTLVSGLAAVTNDLFELNVTENDKQLPGKAVFAAGSHDFAKSGTIYAKESDEVRVLVKREQACDGAVSMALKTNEGKIEPAEVSWTTHNADPKVVRISEVPAGKTATVSFGTATGKLGKGSPSSVKVVCIADDAPEFEQRAYPLSFNRYVAASNVCTVIKLTDPKTIADLKEGSFKRTLSFSKLSGSLPSGIKAAWDKAEGLLISGVPSKAGDYGPVYYQVTESVSYKTTKNKSVSKKTVGFVTKLTISVADPAVPAAQGGDPRNATCTKSRAFTDLIVNGSDPVLIGGKPEVLRRLYGTLNLTIPANTGKVSAKYICEAGTISFTTAKSWSRFTEDDSFVAELSGSGKNSAYKLKVEALSKADEDGNSIVLTLTDPNVGEPLTVKHNGQPWAKGDETSAKAWEGYYTVALPTYAVVSEETEGFASTGTGYLTLKMEGTSACNAGKFTWALMLPNGTTMSGSSTLTKADKNSGYTDDNAKWHDVALLPIFKKASTDRFAGVISVLKDAKADIQKEREGGEKAWRGTVLISGDRDDPRSAYMLWRHSEAASAANAKAGFETGFDVRGALYDKTEDLGACCRAFFQSEELDFNIDVTNLVSEQYGELLSEENPIARIKVSASKMSVDKDEPNPQVVTISLNRSTGIVTGSLKLGYGEAGKTLSVKYAGVILNGWGKGCGCEDPTCPADKYMPFVNGSWYFTDKVNYFKIGAKSPSTLSAKRGAAFDINVD